ncbi:outer membrane-stress sensor serine endopeptidase DegS [Vibrio sp.]|nr:outer membrane-stress sensor serine endopeptidase DegS [Vibrio sp.]
MLSFLLRSVILGVATAALVLMISPYLHFPATKDIAYSAPKKQSALQLSYRDAVRKAGPAVVNIYSRKYNEEHQLSLETQGLGSGVIVSEKGYIITNYHVISQADQIIVALQDGRIEAAQLVGKDRRTDLAILKIQSQNLPVIPLNSSHNPEVGDVVLAIGNPYNLGQTTTFGIISATGRSSISADGRQSFIQTDAAINKGNSGGALVNSKGELVGINTASFQQATDIETYGISFAIPYTLAATIMEKIIADGRVVRGYFGIDAQDINTTLGTEHHKGIYVLRVTPGSPAHRAGVQPKDIILDIAGQTITGQNNIMDIITNLRPGSTAKVKLLRKGVEVTLPVVIGEDYR